MTFKELEEQEKLRAEAFSSRVEREILKALYDFRDINPLRPKDILQNLPSEMYFSSASRLAYHLDKLCRAGLITRKYVGKKLTWYKLTEAGREFYEKLPKRNTPEDEMRFLAKAMSPYAPLGVSEDQIRQLLESLLQKREVSSSEQRGSKKEAS